jgi:hypothetical protein
MTLTQIIEPSLGATPPRKDFLVIRHPGSSAPVAHHQVSQFARFVLPWLAALAVSSTLATGLNQILVHDSLVAQAESRANPPVAVPTALPDNEPNMLWVTLSLVDEQGNRTSVACLVDPRLFAADAVEFSFAEFQRMRADMKCQLPDAH